LAIGALFLSVALAAPGAGSGQTAALSVTQIAPGVFVHQGVQEDASAANADAIANVGFIIGTDSVAVIDPGGSEREGMALRAAIGARTTLPIRWVIMTHVHPDHIFGAAAFRADHPDFVGHERLPAALAARGAYYLRRLHEAIGDAANGSEIVPPTMRVSRRIELDLGGRRLAVEAHGPAHSDCDLTVFDDRTQTFWLGDLLFVDRIPAIDGSLEGWLDELRRVTATAASRAVPGHGPASVSWPQAAAAERRYLEAVLRDTRAALAAGVDIADAYRRVAQSERGNWRLFDDYHARNVTRSYKELEWQ
jgi:quinoprotein relay system zinc metallohydrolase 2